MASFAIDPDDLTIPTEFSPTAAYIDSAQKISTDNLWIKLTGISFASHMSAATPVYDTYATILLRTHFRYPSDLSLIGITKPLVPFTYVGMTVKAIDSLTFDTHPFGLFGYAKSVVFLKDWLLE